MTIVIDKHNSYNDLVFNKTDKGFLDDYLVTPYEKVLQILNKVKVCLKVYEENTLFDEITYVINKIETRSLYGYANDFEFNENDKNNLEIKSFIETINEYSERSNFKQFAASTFHANTKMIDIKAKRLHKNKANTVMVQKTNLLKDQLEFDLNQNKKEKDIISKKLSDCNHKFGNLDNILVKVNYSPLVENEKINEIDELLYKDQQTLIDNIEFNIFKYFSKYNEDSFEILVRYMLKGLDLYPLINLNKLSSFSKGISKGYEITPKYHNHIHGVDVGHTLYSFILFSNNFEEKFKFSKLDILSLIIGAFCHDLGHPGFNNSFHINSLSTFAIKYNDKSVLENFHASEATRIMLLPENNIIDCLEKESFKLFRKHFIEAILATDMTLHVKTNSIIKAKLNSLEIKEGRNVEKMVNESDKFDSHQELLNFFLHTADIAHNSKKFEISFNWVCRLSEEFWNQGDYEKSNNLPISFLCDRTTADVPKSQIGFIKGIIIPSFEILLDMLPELNYTMIFVNENLDYWSKMTKEEFEIKLNTFSSQEFTQLIEQENEEINDRKESTKKKVEFAQNVILNQGSTRNNNAPSIKFEMHFSATDLDGTIYK